MNGEDRSRRQASALPRRTLLAGLGGLVMAPRLLAQAASAPTVPPAAIDNTLEIEGDALAARLAHTRMSVGVRVNGRGPLRFTVDSGADRTVIGASAAQLLGLEAAEHVLLHSTTGSERVGTVAIDRLQIGNSLIRDISAPALPERFIGAQGLLGIDALADQRLLLDFERRLIVVQDTRRVAATPVTADEIVVVARRRNGQLILTEASVGPIGIYAIIDSGSEVTVGNSALRERIFARRRPPKAEPMEIVGVTGGRITADAIVMPQMQIGGVTMQQVTIAFFDSPPFRLFGLDRQPALLLGTDVLGAFARVSLDFRARKVRFRLRA